MDIATPDTDKVTRMQSSGRVLGAQRRDQILRTGAALFQKKGYGGVRIDDIGTAIGISGPAIYRHFAGKEDLLSAIGTTFLDAVLAATEDVLGEGITESSLAAVVKALVDTALDRPAELAVTIRELWNLSDINRTDIATRWDRISTLWGRILEITYPHTRPDVSLYVRAACGIILGASRTPPSTPRDQLLDLACTLIFRVVTTPLPTQQHGPATTAPKKGAWVRASRREQILEAAIPLFRERGFRGVTLADICESIGMTASASYRHFDNKEDILATAIDRAGIRVAMSNDDALAYADTATDALDRMVRAYIDVCVSNRDLIAVSLSEYHHIPQIHQRRRARMAVFFDEWTHCLTTIDPELTVADAHVLVRAVSGLVTESARSRRVSRRPHPARDLHFLVRGALALP